MVGRRAGLMNKQLKRVSYIDQLIHETLRLRPPVPMGFPRETSARGFTG